MRPISRKEVENTIQLLKAKVAMREKYLHYSTLRSQLERQVIEASRLTLAVPQQLMEQFLSAHKHQSEAMAEIEQVVIAELKSQVAIHEAMLTEGERGLGLIVPG